MRNGNKEIIQNDRERTQSRVGPLPPAAFVVHLVENRVPHVSLHICAKVFVETRSRATVVAADFSLIVCPSFSLVILFPDDVLCNQFENSE